MSVANYIHADYIRLISQYTTFYIRWMSRCFHLRVYTRVEGLSVTLDNNHTFCTMEVYMPPCISHSTGSQLFACMSTCALSMHAQELIRHFEEHSLGIYFPSINTILRYPYQEEQHNSQSKQFNVLPMNFICMHCKLNFRRKARVRRKKHFDISAICCSRLSTPSRCHITTHRAAVSLAIISIILLYY